MTTALPVGPGTPYVTPSLLINAPTGIAWSTIPPGRSVTDTERYAAQLNMCQRATAEADKECNQVLRATIDTEFLSGPDFRVTVQNQTGNGRLILQRWPILSIQSVAVAANNVFPRQFTTVPAGYYDIENPVVGLYGTAAPSGAGEGGQSILIAPGWITWALGRNGYRVKVQYTNGWPHTSLTADAAPGDQTITVDDCTGWATTSETLGTTGVTGVLYDNAQEQAQAISTSEPSGAGTVQLAAPLLYPHGAGTMFSAMPASIQWGCILHASSQALTRGATATTVQTIPGGGGSGSSSSGSKRASDLDSQARAEWAAFKRTI